MAAKSIGSLYIDIEARTATMERDLAGAKKQINDLAKNTQQASSQVIDSVDKQGAAWTKLASTLRTGLVSSLGLVLAESKTVSDGIRSIPGVSGSTIASIDLMNYRLHESKVVLDQTLASALAFVSKGMSELGYYIGGTIYGREAYDDARSKEADDQKKATVYALAGYNKEMAAIQEQINAIDSQTAAELHLKDIRGQRLDYLREEAQLLRMMANGEKTLPGVAANHPVVSNYVSQFAVTGISEADRQQLNLQAKTAELQAAREEMELYKANATQMEKALALTGRQTLSQKGLNEQLDYWKSALAAANQEVSVGLRLIGDGKEGEGLLKEADGWKKIAEAQTHVSEIQKKMKEPFMEFENAFKNGFSELSTTLTDFVNTGKFQLNDFLLNLAKQIEQTFFKLAIVNPLLNSMFGGAGGAGGSVLPTLFSSIGGGGGPAWGGEFAKGGPVSGNGPVLVGEMGPELFVPPAGGGTIVPNNKLGGGGAQQVNYIDARGADATAVQRLERIVTAMNGSIEHRAISAVVGAKRRQGSLGSALT